MMMRMLASRELKRFIGKDELLILHFMGNFCSTIHTHITW